MANRRESPIPYLGLNGTFADYDQASLYYAGALGQRTSQDNKEYQVVMLILEQLVQQDNKEIQVLQDNKEFLA